MADKLTFSSMTWDLLEEKHGISVTANEVLFEGCAPVEPSPTLMETLRRARRLRLVNERARSNRLIDPVLAELDTIRFGQILTIPEFYLEVPGKEGLCGLPDFLLSASPAFKAQPIIAIVEAKKDDIDGGLAPCAAELYASYLLNKGRPVRLFGAVTTGIDWKFVRFDAAELRVRVDVDDYTIAELPKLLGVLCHVVDVTLAALKGA